MFLKYLVSVVALIAAFLAGTLVPEGSTQGQQARFLKIEYLRVAPGKGPAYRELENEVWKPIHQARADRGLIDSWAVYGNHFPGTAQEYQYITLTTYPSFDLLESSNYPELFAEVRGMKNYDQILERTLATRDMLKQDLWVLLEHTD